jgi:uncharacterized membrane protein (DUF4010 family)
MKTLLRTAAALAIAAASVSPALAHDANSRGSGFTTMNVPGFSYAHGNSTATHQGIMLATAAMTVRNAVILVLLAPTAAAMASASYALMLAACVAYARAHGNPVGRAADAPAAGEVELAMPFSLWSAIKFGFIFLVLHILGAVTQKYFGNVGFYAVSVIGGTVSSASAVAAAGSLFGSHDISAQTASTGAILASIASVAINLPFIMRARQRQLTTRLSIAMGVIAVLGVAGILLQGWALSAMEKL